MSRERTKATWLTSDMKLNKVMRSIKYIFTFKTSNSRQTSERRGSVYNTWLRNDMKSNEEGRSLKWEKNNMVITEKRIHLFPYRTQKLSSSSLMVLRPKGLGRVGHSQLLRRLALYARLFLSYSKFLLWLEYTNHQWKSQVIFNFKLILTSNRIM